MIINWQQLQTPPPLLAKVVHIWCASLRTSSQRLNDSWNLLLEDEKKAADKFISVQAKENFIICTPRGGYQLEVKVLAGKQNLLHPVSSFELMEVTI